MAVNPDLIIPEADVLADMEVLEEEGIQEMTEAVEEEVAIEMETRIATVDVVDGNTVKLKDSNYVINLR